MAYKVYWIHGKDDIDPEEEGYVGVTRLSIEERLYRHRKYGNYKLKKILKGKYDVKILHEVEDEHLSYILEEEWRPYSNIGANISSGGKQKHLSKRSFETVSLKGEERTENQKKQSEIHSKRLKERYNNDPKMREIIKRNGYNGKGRPKSDHMRKKLSEYHKQKKVCPHCEKEGTGIAMLRWHFDNCSKKYD